MKKSILILALFLTYYISYSQTIHSLNVSPNGTDSVDVNLEIFYHHYIDYLGFDQEVVGNVINLDVCYHHAPANVIVYDNRTFNIPINNPIDYTLNITVYRSVDLNTCDYSEIIDTATLQFTTPLTETVYLGVEDFEAIANQISVYPNPVKNNLYIDVSGSLDIKNMELYNILGREIETYSNSFEAINVNGLSNGVYFLKLNTNKGVVQKKIIVNDQ